MAPNLSTKVEIGVFDHLDRNDLPLSEYYEARLKIVEAYDRAGFYAYHVAEHHSTPLGMAASPSVFLAAVAQRTRRLRFGPLVYALPLYHPLRMIEEICMLDQMSNGRLEIGFGRGSSATEVSFFGQSYDVAQKIYAESLEIILKGLTSETLDYDGEFYRLASVPMELTPVQKPYPPVWYGVHSTDSAGRAAKRGLHIVSLSTPTETRSYSDHYRTVWDKTYGKAPMPKIGVSRFVFVAEREDVALETARRAYARWHKSFTFIVTRAGLRNTHPRPPTLLVSLRSAICRSMLLSTRSISSGSM
jgi:alkanesulfonate monooxygenase SsuD/methylene tetrahydromethanopterin reductase-like flavin-dependent oxidoreductase (luciferase family)